MNNKQVQVHEEIAFGLYEQEISNKTPIVKTGITRSIGLRKSSYTNQAKFDASKSDAIVMPRLRLEKQVDVVIDPFLAKHLRQHQIAGIQFMYSCIMGLQESVDGDVQGCILADEMGLGKTLQTITLLWTLLKQSPFLNSSTVAKRVLIVCPASLLNNWRQEFRKWLGDVRIQTFVVEPNATSVKEFFMARKQVMIIGYEKLRKFKDDIVNGQFDVCVCDEGHRIKNGEIQAAQILAQLPTMKRILLSGTPIQNDLTEFYHMVHFVNPNFLGTLGNFKKAFEGDIVAGSESGCSTIQKNIGKEKLELLYRMTRPFILRRTNTVNTEFLPPKSEIVVFCKLKNEQKLVYRSIVDEYKEQDTMGMLALLGNLKKAANYDEKLDDVLKLSKSGKFEVIAALLDQIAVSGEKAVIVSHWTTTLDVFEQHVKKKYQYERIDGSTASNKRQDIVDRFNRNSNIFCFLLSSKAGGVGLNLVGASRLIMVDVDWNPSVEQQAMARIWRDGQVNPVFIYRFLSTGTIEERIYQRQLVKQNLADSMLDVQSNTVSFTKEELKELCLFKDDTDCLIHDMVECKCMGTTQDHFKAPFANVSEVDPILYAAATKCDTISFIAKANSFSNEQ